MNPILAALLSSPGLAAPASPSLATPAAGSTDAQSSLLFKVQFNQALAAVTGTTNGSAATANPATDTLTATLQKKIADLLNQGVSLTDIVKQLAQSLATQFAQAFGGDPSTIQANLQLAFGTALSPPGNNGPPLSAAETASALAQRFRQIADLAARVSGETTGQSNRLFAARSSDAATTAGVQAAPQSQPTNGPGQLSADSILTGASSALASLTTALTPAPTLASGQPVQASTPGDGKTVVVPDATPIGTNGDTVLGRILARATLAAQAAAAPTGAPAPLKAPDLGATTVATDVATAAATTATGTTRVQIDPSLNAFLRSFTSAIASGDAQPSGGAKQLAWDDTTLQTLLGAPVTSSQAPTVAAFMPVQAPFTIDPTNIDAPQQTVLPQPYTTVADPNGVVDQVLKGVFLSNDGTSSNVSLKLLPDNLGTVNVRLTVDGGNVSAQVVAQTSDARDALLAGQAQLTRSLADAGLKLTSFNVNLAGGSFGSFQQQQQQQASMQHKSFGRRLLLDGVDTNENSDAVLSAIPSFGPPLVANMNWAALNYLA